MIQQASGHATRAPALITLPLELQQLPSECLSCELAGNAGTHIFASHEDFVEIATFPSAERTDHALQDVV